MTFCTDYSRKEGVPVRVLVPEVFFVCKLLILKGWLPGMDSNHDYLRSKEISKLLILKAHRPHQNQRNNHTRTALVPGCHYRVRETREGCKQPLLYAHWPNVIPVQGCVLRVMHGGTALVGTGSPQQRFTKVMRARCAAPLQLSGQMFSS